LNPVDAEASAVGDPALRLAAAVGRAVEELDRARSRLAEAELRVRDLELLLARFARGEDDPVRLAARIRAVEEENRLLRERLEEGRAGVERLLSRVRFLENR